MVLSRIGNKPVSIPEKVELSLNGNFINIKGPKGELSTEIVDERIKYEVNENELTFSRTSDVAEVRSLHGLYRSLVANNIEGVLEGYNKTLLLQGVGHRASLKGSDLEILCGFSHPVIFKKVEDINFEVPDQNTIIVSGHDPDSIFLKYTTQRLIFIGIEGTYFDKDEIEENPNSIINLTVPEPQHAG